MSRKVESSAVFCFCTILKSIKYNHSFIGGCKKRGCFAVKLTIWVDPTPLTVSFRYFFCVFDLIVLLVLESRIPPYCCCSVTDKAPRPSISTVIWVLPYGTLYCTICHLRRNVFWVSKNQVSPHLNTVQNQRNVGGCSLPNTCSISMLCVEVCSPYQGFSRKK